MVFTLVERRDLLLQVPRGERQKIFCCRTTTVVVKGLMQHAALYDMRTVSRILRKTDTDLVAQMPERAQVVYVCLKRATFDVDFGADILQEETRRSILVDMDGVLTPMIHAKYRMSVIGIVEGSISSKCLRLNDIITKVNGSPPPADFAERVKSMLCLNLHVVREAQLEALRKAPESDAALAV